jgi:hypothetical protein
MKLTPVDIEEIKLLEKHHSHRKAQKVIEEFMNSGCAAMEVTYNEGEYKNPASCQSTLSKAVTSLKAACFLTLRDGRLYIVRRDIAVG